MQPYNLSIDSSEHSVPGTTTAIEWLQKQLHNLDLLPSGMYPDSRHTYVSLIARERIELSFWDYESHVLPLNYPAESNENQTGISS